VAAVQYEDVERLHADLEGTPYQANRVLALLSKMFTLAEKWRMRPHGSNPCRGIDRYKEVSRRRYLTVEEAGLLAAALRKHETAYPREVAFVYLLLFTGARPDEIARAEVGWVSRGVLHLSDSKTGERNVYLPPQVAGLLAALPTGQPTLLGVKSPRKLWDKIRSEIGSPDLRLYDLRHQYASVALAQGHSLAQIGELLGHKSVQTTHRYAHLLPSKAHEIAASTATAMLGLLGRAEL
jgi:integrase